MLEKPDDPPSVATLMRMHKFSTDVCTALNEHKVQPGTVDDKDISAIMVIVAREGEVPIGSSLNYDTETGKWTAVPQAEMAQRWPDEKGHGH